MTDEQFALLQQRLDSIITLLVLGLDEDKGGKNAIIALDRVGLPAKEIAHMLGLTTNNVRVILHRAKKES